MKEEHKRRHKKERNMEHTERLIARKVRNYR